MIKLFITFCSLFGFVRFPNLLSTLININLLMLIWFGIIPFFISIMTGFLSIIFTNFDELMIMHQMMIKINGYGKWFNLIFKIKTIINNCSIRLKYFDKFFIYIIKKIHLNKIIDTFENDDLNNYLISTDLITSTMRMKNEPNIDDIKQMGQNMNILMKQINSMKKFKKGN